MPAAPARPAPIAKVTEMTRSTGTPMSGTKARSQEMARIAMPSSVRCTRKSSRSISASETTTISSCSDESERPPTLQTPSPKSFGMLRG